MGPALLKRAVGHQLASAAHEPLPSGGSREASRTGDASARGTRAGSPDARNDGRRNRLLDGFALLAFMCELLKFDLRAGFFKLLLELLRVGLVHSFLHRLRRAFDQVLGFL